MKGARQVPLVMVMVMVIVMAIGDSDSDGDDGEHREQLMIRWSARKPHKGGALSAHGAEKRGRKWVPRLSVPRTLAVGGCGALFL